MNIINIRITGQRKRSYLVRGFRKSGQWKNDFIIYGDDLADAVKNSLGNIITHYEIGQNIISINLQNDNFESIASLIIVHGHGQNRKTTNISINYDAKVCRGAHLPIEFTVGSANNN